jgi:hypothetical protein
MYKSGIEKKKLLHEMFSCYNPQKYKALNAFKKENKKMVE